VWALYRNGAQAPARQARPMEEAVGE